MTPHEPELLLIIVVAVGFFGMLPLVGPLLDAFMGKQRHDR